MRTTAITTWSFDVLVSLSLSLFSLVNHFLSLVQSHTHNHNNMFSLHTMRACALFFVQIFPSLFFYAIAVFWSLKEKREREREKKSVCKLLKSFMNERIEAKKGKTRCSHTLVVFFSLVLFIASIYFYLYWLSWVLLLQKKTI